jgi:pilus assembly protein CpaF
MPAAVEIIDAEVREAVRRQGLDPVGNPAAVRRIIDEIVSAYDERSLTRQLPPLGDPASTAKAVLDAVAGFGVLQPYFDDPTVEEIWINEPSRVFIARHGKSELTTTILTAQDVRDLVERMLKSSGRRLDVSNPTVDATLPDGSRLHVVIPDITADHWAVNIRKFVVRATHLDELVSLGTLTPQVARFLEACVVAGLNIVVAGGTQAGKTTLLNCLLAAVPGRERVVSCEEVFELKAPLPDIVRMQTRQASLEGTGEITLRQLVTEALRMRPQRIVVGEVRQAECLDLLIALNSGMPGMSSIHANSAREAVTKLCTLPLLAGESYPDRSRRRRARSRCWTTRPRLHSHSRYDAGVDAARTSCRADERASSTGVETEGVPGRVEQDPHVLLRLVRRELSPELEGSLGLGFEIGNLEI